MSVITLSVAAAAWGQELDSKKMSGSYLITPGSLSYEGKPSILVRSESDEEIFDVYNSNLEKVHSFTISPSCFYTTYVRQKKTGEWETTYERNDTLKYTFESFGGYYDYDKNVYSDAPLSFSQTLFNADDKFEYIIPISEKNEKVHEFTDAYGDSIRQITSGDFLAGFKIVNEDGATLFTINTDVNKEEHINELIKIGNKTYITTFSNDDYETWYLIDQQSSSIESVKRIPTGKSQIYSVDGRKLNNTQRGINIIRKDDGSSTKQLIR